MNDFDEDIFSSAKNLLNTIFFKSNTIAIQLNKLTDDYENNCCKIKMYCELKQLIKLCKKIRIYIHSFLEIKYTIDFMSEVCPCAKNEKASDLCALNYQKISNWTDIIEIQIALIQKYCKD